jgi:hypothetical protein
VIPTRLCEVPDKDDEHKIQSVSIVVAFLEKTSSYGTFLHASQHHSGWFEMIRPQEVKSRFTLEKPNETVNETKRSPLAAA